MSSRVRRCGVCLFRKPTTLTHACTWQVPSRYVEMALKPTPIHEWRLPGLPDSLALFVKRDDLSGMELSGNKVCSRPGGVTAGATAHA